MYYAKISEQNDDYWLEDGEHSIPTTRLIGPFKYREDIERFMETNDVLEVIQID